MSGKDRWNYLPSLLTLSLTLHGSLEGIYGIDLCDDDASSEPSQSLDTAFAHVAITGHHRHFTSDHHVCGSLDAVDQALPAAVKVVKLTLQHTNTTYVISDFHQSRLSEWERREWSGTFVTESLTLMAGTFSSPFFIILDRLWTPVVVSSDNPRMPEKHIYTGYKCFFEASFRERMQVVLRFHVRDWNKAAGSVKNIWSKEHLKHPSTLKQEHEQEFQTSGRLLIRMRIKMRLVTVNKLHGS